MRKPKVDPVNLPYASGVASYFGDQGAVQGNSFLGRMFNGGSRRQIIRTQSAAASAPARPNTFKEKVMGVLK